MIFNQVKVPKTGQSLTLLDGQVEVARRNNMLLIRISQPHLTDESTISAVGAMIEDWVQQIDRPQIIIDMSRVAHMTSSFVGQLVHIHLTTEAHQGGLSLAGAAESLRDVFEVAQLNEIIPMFGSTREAITATKVCA